MNTPNLDAVVKAVQDDRSIWLVRPQVHKAPGELAALKERIAELEADAELGRLVRESGLIEALQEFMDTVSLLDMARARMLAAPDAYITLDEALGKFNTAPSAAPTTASGEASEGKATT